MNRSNTPKVPLAPDPRELADRAARAWTERMAVRPAGGGVYHVETESDRQYAVDVPGRRCTCPDYRYRGARCKHMRRVAIEITERRVPPPGERATDCVVCGREAFVRAGRRVPLCSECEPVPGDAVRDRETGDRLVIAGVPDRRATAAEIPEAGCTVAAYPTNERYPDDDPVVEAVYAGSVENEEEGECEGEGGDGEPRRYAFPLSRLERPDRGT